MRILLVGSGAREHAISWKLLQSNLLSKLWVWPLNPGFSCGVGSLNIGSDASFEELYGEILRIQIDAVICGPEKPLAEGLADFLEARRIPVFGPKKEAARLEASKAFAKDVMVSAGVPTAAYHVVHDEESCRNVACDMFARLGGVVLKASGLAAGKGVFVCHQEAEISAALKMLYSSPMKSSAGEVVVEELLIGRECSYFALIGNGEIKELGFAVDFKRLRDKDEGPNTGGMGCYTPVPWLPEDAGHQVQRLVVLPTLAELSKRSLEYTGFLYVGLMWGAEGPKVVEFNVRLGDPEAQILAVADQRDWLTMIADILQLTNHPSSSEEIEGKAVGVVLAAEGYPYESAKDHVIFTPNDLGPDLNTSVFTAAVHAEGFDSLRSGNGRVLTVVGKGQTLAEARDYAYSRVEKLTRHWPQAQWRRDIALRAVEEELALSR
jgi:phosphoribosylamine--glycine ligase